MTYRLPNDVARCLGIRCAIREKCLRNRAIFFDDPEAWIVYMQVPYQPKTEQDTCEHYIPLENSL